MDEHAYFRAIEERFIQLRGAPLLLSPTDYRVASRWRTQGIPLTLIHRVLGEVFEQRAERGVVTPVQSLRYCAAAVEAAWKRVGALDQADRRERPDPIEAGPRLEALAAAIPESVPGVESLRAEVRALEGDAERIEDALSEIDRRLMAAVTTALDAQSRSDLERRVEESLGALGARLGADEAASSRDRLFDQALRRDLGLPILSLFTDL